MRIFLLLIFINISVSILATPIDSIRTETVNGNIYIIHKVEPRETLFGLSRRYNVSVDDIKKNNPIAAEGLKIGDVIRIPYKVKSEQNTANVHVVKSGETLFSISRLYNIPVADLRNKNRLSGDELNIGQALKLPDSRTTTDSFPIEKVNELPDTASYQWHVVRQGETLFALSRMYNIEVPELKKWNSLTHNNISIGDSLIIGYSPKNRFVEPANEVESNTTDDQSQDNFEKNKNSDEEPVASSNDDVEVTKQVVTNEANYEEVVETGLAELIENSGDTRKYLALHRTAKIGTIIRIKNEMNDREVFVRVLGKLPDTGINDKVLIKISQAAFDRLNAIDKRFRVKISYFPD